MFQVLAFTVKPRQSADTRFRVLQFRAIAEQSGVRIDHRSLMGKRYFQWQIQNQQLLLRMLLYPVLLLVRLWQVVVVAPRYDAVWVAREMAPLGPPLFERLLAARCKRVIFDVDDALHISDKKMARLIPRLLRDRGKFARMAGRYAAVVCGSENLAEFYSRYAKKVYVIPTVVDASDYAACTRSSAGKVRVGWIGTPLNRDHLEIIYPALCELLKERDFELVVVGLTAPLDWNLPGIRCVEWKLEHEVSYFSDFDIGIMPLRDSEFARGKCAFKLVQYMAAGIPVVASPVGANCQVVEHGKNGYLAETQQEWYGALKVLMDDAEKRRAMGEYGRECVRRAYSAEAAWSSYQHILTGTTQEAETCVA